MVPFIFVFTVVVLTLGCLSSFGGCFLYSRSCYHIDCNNHGHGEGFNGNCTCRCEDGWRGDACEIEELRCSMDQTLLSLSSGVISTNENASSCEGTENDGSDAFVMNHCNVDIQMLWKPGAKVMNNCNKLPKYIPISTFEDGNFGANITQAAIFLGCIQNGIKVGIQTCGNIPRIEKCTIGGRGYLNADLYYVIQ